MGHLVHLSHNELVERRILRFKRYRFSASPATGLVGMQENTFLSAFFGCVGFLPLTKESQIRETMVKIMVNAASQQKPAFSTDRFGEDGQFGTLFGGCTFGNASGISRLRKEPSFSTFWSAVALGALAKGSPFEAVETYCQLAQGVLAACRLDSTKAELAKASAILTYLYSFMGNMTKFREYLALSEYFLQASIDQGSADIHSGLPDLLLHFRKVGNVEDGPMDSSWTHHEGPPQLEKVATEGDLYPFIAQSFRVFDEAVYAKAQERCAGDLERFYSWGPSHRIYDTNDPLPGEVSEAIMAVFETTNSLEFEPLQETVDRQNIRAGVGDLLINGNYRTLLFENAAKGDLRATLEKLDRSIEVYERYPGLCRCIMGSHTSHMLLGILAAIDDSRARRMYNRLRGTFNSCLASHTAPIPPLDEWQGMAAICNDLHCRVSETIIKSEHMKAFTVLSVDSIHDSAAAPQATSNPHGKTGSEVLPSRTTHREIVDIVPTCPGSEWTGPNATDKWAGKNDPSQAICCAGAAVAPPASRSDLSSQWDTGFGKASNISGVATEVRNLWPRSAGIDGHREDNVLLENDEHAGSDLLEVVNAVLNEVHDY